MTRLLPHLLLLIALLPIRSATAYDGLWWWDQQRSGQGVAMLRECGRYLGAFYYYDSTGKGRWATFSGPENHLGFSGDLLGFTGPALGSDWNATPVKAAVAGSLEVDFLGTNSTRFSYSIGGQGATLNLQPFPVGNGTPGSRDGIWWDSGKPGQAVMLAHGGTSLSGAWYVYDTDGSGIWAVFTGNLNGSCATMDLNRFTGPPLDQAWNNALLTTRKVGSVELCFQSDTQASFAYQFEGRSGQLDLQPFPMDCPDHYPQEQDMHGQINAHRQGAGHNALTWSESVAEISRGHSQDMADGKVAFGHDGFATRVDEIGQIISWSRAGENVAFNQGFADPVSTAVEGLLNSPGHLANIVGDFNTTGIGVTVTPSGRYFFTQIFVKTP